MTDLICLLTSELSIEAQYTTNLVGILQVLMNAETGQVESGEKHISDYDLSATRTNKTLDQKSDS